VAEAGIKIIHHSSRAGTVDVAVIAAVVVDFEEVGDSLDEGVGVAEVLLHRNSGTTVEVLLLLRSSGMTVGVLLPHLSIGMMVGVLLLVEVLLLRSSGTTVEVAVAVAVEITMNVNDTETIVTLVIRGRDDRLARMALYTYNSKC
jgi:hypothetical protein